MPATTEAVAFLNLSGEVRVLFGSSVFRISASGEYSVCGCLCVCVCVLVLGFFCGDLCWSNLQVSNWTGRLGLQAV